MANSFDFDFIPLFPKGKKSVIILSHDVDDPLKYAMLDSYKLFQKPFKTVNIVPHRSG